MKLNKQYQLWYYNGEGYYCVQCDTLKECLEYDNYSQDWCITKYVEYEVKEVE
jgi:hypothetical protein